MTGVQLDARYTMHRHAFGRLARRTRECNGMRRMIILLYSLAFRWLSASSNEVTDIISSGNERCMSLLTLAAARP